MINFGKMTQAWFIKMQGPYGMRLRFFVTEKSPPNSSIPNSLILNKILNQIKPKTETLPQIYKLHVKKPDKYLHQHESQLASRNQTR